MDDLKRYLGLILACGTLALFLAGPAMVQAEGNQEDGQLGTEDWAFEYQGDIDERPVSKECAYENIGDNYEYCCKVGGRYLVVLFNIAMDQGQSFGGSIFEYQESDNRRQPLVGNNGNNLSIVHQVGNSSVDTFAIVSQDGDGNVGVIRQLGPH